MITSFATKRMCRIAGAAAGLLLLSMAANATVLTRGPYLQLGTADSIVVRWRTEQSSDSIVRFGTGLGDLSSSVSSAAESTEHEIALSGLNSDTRYYYSIGDTSGVLAGGDASHTFRTAPVPGTSKPTRVWVIGDSGTANANAAAVRDAYKTYAGSQDTELWLMLGDNAYNDGTDSQYQAAVFDMYPDLLRQVPLWSTLGNHDGISANSGMQTGPYYDIFTLPTGGEAGGEPSGTEAYYSFDYGNIHFVCLDSHESDRSVTGSMLTWLQFDLAATDKQWIIAFWHHPPYTKGSHDSDTETQLRDMRQNALPVLEDFGVDLVLTGHSHSYERSYLLDGHYGSSGTLVPSTMVLDGGDGDEAGDGAYQKPNSVTPPHQGAVYAVAGSSGKVGGGSLDHPAMLVSLSVLGSMVLDIDGERLDALFLDNSGTVRDRFTISKGPDHTEPTIETLAAIDANTVNVVFHEKVQSVSAEDAANYAIDHEIAVTGASLAADGRTVVLTTTTLTEGIVYSLTVANVTDLAGNAVAAGTQAQFELIVLVTREFQDGVAPDAGYAGTRDTYISENAPSSNFGAAPVLLADGDDPGGSGFDLSSLLKWDISSIPFDAQVESVSVTVYVTNLTSSTYELYALTRDWFEGEATWGQSRTASPWSAPGATGSGDRDATVLGTLQAPATGPRTVVLNDDGVGAVQGWIDASAMNYGLIVADAAAGDGVDFDSRETAGATRRPKLTVIYSLSPGGDDTTPPTVPGNLHSTTVTPSSIALAWDPSTDDQGVAGYKIYRGGNMIDTSAATGYTDTGLLPGTGYEYVVSAFDAANNESVPSAPLAVSTAAQAPSVHVADITIERRLNGKKWQLARSQGTIRDGAAQLAANATVNIAWSGLVTGAGSAVTGNDGTAIFDSPKAAKNATGQFVITVTDVQHSTGTYDAAQNLETSDCIDHTGAACQGPGSSLIHIADIDVTMSKQGKNWRGQATTIVLDEADNPVAGASVSGDWTLEPLAGETIVLGTGGGTTGFDGTVVTQSPKSRANSGDWFRFTVTEVVLNGATYDDGSNLETSDSAIVP